MASAGDVECRQMNRKKLLLKQHDLVFHKFRLRFAPTVVERAISSEFRGMVIQCKIFIGAKTSRSRPSGGASARRQTNWLAHG